MSAFDCLFRSRDLPNKVMLSWMSAMFSYQRISLVHLFLATNNACVLAKRSKQFYYEIVMNEYLVNTKLSMTRGSNNLGRKRFDFAKK